MIELSKQVIQDVIDLYESGQIRTAKTILETAAGGDYIVTKHETENEIMKAEITVSRALSDWVCLAIDALRKECGEDVFSVYPAEIALKNALSFFDYDEDSYSDILDGFETVAYEITNCDEYRLRLLGLPFSDEDYLKESIIICKECFMKKEKYHHLFKEEDIFCLEAMDGEILADARLSEVSEHKYKARIIEKKADGSLVYKPRIQCEICGKIIGDDWP